MGNFKCILKNLQFWFLFHLAMANMSMMEEINLTVNLNPIQEFIISKYNQYQTNSDAKYKRLENSHQICSNV